MKHKRVKGNLYALPRPVDFTNRGTSRYSDFHVALLGSMGFSTNYIMKETGLTFSQVTYRLNKAQIKRAAYRNGENPMAKMIVRSARPAIETALERHIERAINNENNVSQREVHKKAV